MPKDEKDDDPYQAVNPEELESGDDYEEGGEGEEEELPEELEDLEFDEEEGPPPARRQRPQRQRQRDTRPQSGGAWNDDDDDEERDSERGSLDVSQLISAAANRGSKPATRKDRETAYQCSPIINNKIQERHMLPLYGKKSDEQIAQEIREKSSVSSPEWLIVVCQVKAVKGKLDVQPTADAFALNLNDFMPRNPEYPTPPDPDADESEEHDDPYSNMEMPEGMDPSIGMMMTMMRDELRESRRENRRLREAISRPQPVPVAPVASESLIDKMGGIEGVLGAIKLAKEVFAPAPQKGSSDIELLMKGMELRDKADRPKQSDYMIPIAGVAAAAFLGRNKHLGRIVANMLDPEGMFADEEEEEVQKKKKKKARDSAPPEPTAEKKKSIPPSRPQHQLPDHGNPTEWRSGVLWPAIDEALSGDSPDPENSVANIWGDFTLEKATPEAIRNLLDEEADVLAVELIACAPNAESFVGSNLPPNIEDRIQSEEQRAQVVEQMLTNWVGQLQNYITEKVRTATASSA